MSEENNLITLCQECHAYAPDDKEQFEEYMKDPVWWIMQSMYNRAMRKESA